MICRRFWISKLTRPSRWYSTLKNSDLDNELIKNLNARGLIATCSDSRIDSAINGKSVSLYCGADPSARSLHVGNLIPMLVLLHFMIRGHNPIALVGGATGEVGDPSGRSSERNSIEKDTREANVLNIQNQMRQFFENGRKYAISKGYSEHCMGQAEFLNNSSWWKNVKFLDFLATFGKHIRVSQMMARDSVKNRLESEQGIGFNEFAYQILQAYDFWHLYSSKNCLIQIGGNDQWGNITAGIDLISRLKSSIKRKETAYGLTVPLLLTPSGEKFGKSAGNAIWLDSNLTKPYHLYQYLINSPDQMIEHYLKILTLVSLKELEEVMARHRENPEERFAQRLLATEVTDLIHGLGSGERSGTISNAFFGSSTVNNQLLADSLESEKLLLHHNREKVIGHPWRDLIASITGKSKSEASRLLKSKSIYHGHERKVVDEVVVNEDHVTDGKWLMIRVGKTNYYVIQLEPEQSL